jgi:hypothetical protein
METFREVHEALKKTARDEAEFVKAFVKSFDRDEDSEEEVTETQSE